MRGMWAQSKIMTRDELEAIESDRLKHRIAEKLAVWESTLRERGIHIDPVSGAVTLHR